MIKKSLINHIFKDIRVKTVKKAWDSSMRVCERDSKVTIIKR